MVAVAVSLVVVGAALAQPPATIPLPSDLKLDTPAADVLMFDLSERASGMYRFAGDSLRVSVTV